MTVGELLRRASSRELAEWMAYDMVRAEDRDPAAAARQQFRDLSLTEKLERAFPLSG